MKCLTAVFLLVLAFAASADPYSRTDAFEHSKDLEIINHSRLFPGFNILDMFGADLSSGPGQTIFDDRTPPEETDFVEFKTIEEVPLIGFSLATQADGAYLRGSLQVTMKIDADDDDVYEIAHGPYPILPGINDLSIIVFTTNFPQVIASKFRLEIKRYPRVAVSAPVSPWLGPRVWELDALTTPNPDRPVAGLSISQEPPLSEPASVTFTAQASDQNGINRVELYKGSTLVATKKSEPYVFPVTGLSGGKHSFRAKAVDNLGAAEWSNPIDVKVSFKPFLLTKPGWINEEFFGFTLQDLAPGQTYMVEASEDLESWTLIDHVYGQETPSEWAFGEQASYLSRFYRVKLVEPNEPEP